MSIMNKKTKHFCFISSCFSREDPRIFKREAKSLVKEGYSVSYLISDIKKSTNIDNIDIISTGYKPQNRFKRFFFNKSKLFNNALKINADIYQISEPELIPLALKLKKFKKKIVFDMREDYIISLNNKQYIPYILRPIFSKFLNNYFHYSLPKFDIIFTVDPNLMDKIQSAYKLRKVFLVTNYPVISSKGSFTFEEYMKRDNLLLYSGSVYRISRQEVLFRALEKFQNLSYLIAGFFWDNYQDDLEKIPYWKSVKYIEGNDFQKVSDFHYEATIGNALRDFSNTGYPNGSLGIIKIYEYMEAGIPIICSDVKIWKEMVSQYNCGICVDPNNSKEIENALYFLINNKVEAYKMGQNGRHAVLEIFNWNTQAIVYIKEINNLL